MILKKNFRNFTFNINYLKIFLRICFFSQKDQPFKIVYKFWNPLPNFVTFRQLLYNHVTS